MPGLLKGVGRSIIGPSEVVIDAFADIDGWTVQNEGANVATTAAAGRMRQVGDGGGSNWDALYRTNTSKVLGTNAIDYFIKMPAITLGDQNDGSQVIFGVRTTNAEVAFEILASKGTDGLFHIITRKASGGSYSNITDSSGIQMVAGGQFRIAVTVAKRGYSWYRLTPTGPWVAHVQNHDLSALAGTVHPNVVCSTIAGEAGMAVDWDDLTEIT